MHYLVIFTVFMLPFIVGAPAQADNALSKAEKSYENLEHDCMAVVLGMEKFNYYLYGS